MKPVIGLSVKNLASVNALLTKVLADGVVLYTKTRKFHWNISGNSFMELHKLFEEHYKKMEQSIDEVAEQINKLGANTPGTMQEFLQHTSLKEAPGKYPHQTEMIKELLKDHEAIIIQLRKNIGDCDEKYKDAGTADLLTDLLREHEKMAWSLRRYLK